MIMITMTMLIFILTTKLIENCKRALTYFGKSGSVSIFFSALKLVARVPLIQADRETVAKQFPELFKGLGQMTGKYHIKLQSNVTS